MYLKRSAWFTPAQYLEWRVRMIPGQIVATLRVAAKKQARKFLRSKHSTRVHHVERSRRGLANSATARNVVLVLGADEAFSMPLAVTLYSALVNLDASRVPEVYVLDGGISPASRRKIQEVALRARPNAKVEFIRAPAARLSTYTLKKERRFSDSIFLRVLIPELLPPSVEKAIYLDSDMVVEEDLTRLWEIDMGDRAVLAVQDLAIPYVSSTPRGLYNWRELGLSNDTPYFNSGLLVLNLRRWREEATGGKILDYLSRHRDHLNMHGNQEGFNAVLANKWGMLDERWNVIHHAYDPGLLGRSDSRHVAATARRKLTRQPYVIHFTARRKPWQPTCIHPARNRFFRYLKDSGWFEPAVYIRWRLRIVPLQAASTLQYIYKTRGRSFRHVIKNVLYSSGRERH